MKCLYYISMFFFLLLFGCLYLHGCTRDEVPDPIKGFNDKPSIKLNWSLK